MKIGKVSFDELFELEATTDQTEREIVILTFMETGVAVEIHNDNELKEILMQELEYDDGAAEFTVLIYNRLKRWANEQ